MPIEHAQWLVPQRVIYAYAWGEVTPDDLAQHNDRMNNLIASGTPLVHVILDSAPDQMLTSPSLRTAIDVLSFIRRDDFGFTAQVGAMSPIAKSGSILLAKVLRARYRMLDTVDEAIDQLKNYDPTVDWSQVDMSVIEMMQNQSV